MRCSDVEVLWDEVREDGDLGRDDVLSHLRRCRTCQDDYKSFEGVRYCLSCLPVVEPSLTLVPRILDHIATLRRGFRSKAPDRLTQLNSPIGVLHIAFRDRAITYIAIDRGEEAAVLQAQIERRLRRPVVVAEAPAWVAGVVARFFSTWQVDAESIDISALTVFEQAALHKAAQIPPGEVRSYGWIAREIGHPLAARAVGQAMARNPVPLFFPCHRVVDASGALHNYEYGIEVKAQLLEMEGYREVARKETRTRVRSTSS